MKGLSVRGADPRNPRYALIAFLLLAVTLLFLLLIHFAVITDHGPPWWSQGAR